jgi:hypothetical protein
VNDPLKYVDPRGLIWGQWDDGKTTHYHWFDGKIGKYNGHDYNAVPELAKGGSSLLIHADNGELVRIRNSGIVRAVEGRWAAAPVVNPAQDQLNQLGGFVHGVGHAVTAVNPIASPLVDAAIDRLIGGVDKSDPGYGNAEAIGNGLAMAPLIFTPLPEAEAAGETTTLYRAVTQPELDNILETGTYQVAKGQEGKYFFQTAEDALDFGQRMFEKFPDHGPYTVTSTQVDRAVIQASEGVHAATEGHALFVPKSQLPLGPVKIGP